MKIVVDKAKDKYMIDQSGKVWEISDGYRLANGKAREVVEVPHDRKLIIEFEKVGKIKW